MTLDQLARVVGLTGVRASAFNMYDLVTRRPGQKAQGNQDTDKIHISPPLEKQSKTKKSLLQSPHSAHGVTASSSRIRDSKASGRGMAHGVSSRLVFFLLLKTKSFVVLFFLFYSFPKLNSQNDNRFQSLCWQHQVFYLVIKSYSSILLFHNKFFRNLGFGNPLVSCQDNFV